MFNGRFCKIMKNCNIKYRLQKDNLNEYREIIEQDNLQDKN